MFAAPPAVGTAAGESNALGIRGLSIHFPAVNLELPTVQLPSLFWLRRGAEMHLDRTIAPFVEGQPAAVAQITPPAAPQMASPFAVGPGQPILIQQALPQSVVAVPQAAPPQAAQPQAVPESSPPCAPQHGTPAAPPCAPQNYPARTHGGHPEIELPEPCPPVSSSGAAERQRLRLQIEAQQQALSQMQASLDQARSALEQAGGQGQVTPSVAVVQSAQATFMVPVTRAASAPQALPQPTVPAGGARPMSYAPVQSDAGVEQATGRVPLVEPAGVFAESEAVQPHRSSANQPAALTQSTNKPIDGRAKGRWNWWRK